MKALVSFFLGLALAGSVALAEELHISARCIAAQCERTADVFSIPLGATVEFQVTNPSGRVLETVKWVLPDGTELYGSPVQRTFETAGTYAVSVIVYYQDGGRSQAALTLHTIAPKPIKTILGIPEQTVYTAVALVVAYAISYVASWLGA